MITQKKTKKLTERSSSIQSYTHKKKHTYITQTNLYHWRFVSLVKVVESLMKKHEVFNEKCECYSNKNKMTNISSRFFFLLLNILFFVEEVTLTA